MTSILDNPVFVSDVILENGNVLRYTFSNKDVAHLFCDMAEHVHGVKQVLRDTIGFKVYGNSDDALNSLKFWADATTESE